MWPVCRFIGQAVKVNWFRYRPGVAQRVGRGIALLFLDRGTRRGWVVSSTPRPHFTPGKDPVLIVQEAGWAPGHWSSCILTKWLDVGLSYVVIHCWKASNPADLQLRGHKVPGSGEPATLFLHHNFHWRVLHKLCTRSDEWNTMFDSLFERNNKFHKCTSWINIGLAQRFSAFVCFWLPLSLIYLPAPPHTLLRVRCYIWIQKYFIPVLLIYILCWGHPVAQLVEALRYNLEGRGFDSQWCHWNFSLT